MDHWLVAVASHHHLLLFELLGNLGKQEINFEVMERMWRKEAILLQFFFFCFPNLRCYYYYYYYYYYYFIIIIVIIVVIIIIIIIIANQSVTRGGLPRTSLVVSWGLHAPLI